MFNVTLYQCSAESNRLNKTDFLENATTYQGNLRENCSIITPAILLDGYQFTGQNYDNLFKFNYMYIEEFERYYFITDITLISNQLIEITGRVDVLESFKNDIYNMEGLLYRTYKEDYAEPLIFDNLTIFESGEYEQRFSCLPIPTYNMFCTDMSYNNTGKQNGNCPLLCVTVVSDIYPLTTRQRSEYLKFINNYGVIPPQIPWLGYMSANNMVYFLNPTNYTVNSDVYNLETYFSSFIAALVKEGENSQVASDIISIMAFPIELIGTGETYTYTIGGKKYSVTNGIRQFNMGLCYPSPLGINIRSQGSPLQGIVPGTNADPNLYYMGSGAKYRPDMVFSCKLTFSRFTDLPPCSEYFIYLPYFGTVSIDINKYINTSTFTNYIYIIYLIDYTTGEANILLCRSESEPSSDGTFLINEILDTYKCQVGVEIAINTSNYAENNRQRTLSFISFLGNLGVGIASGFSSNPIGVLTAAQGMGTSVGMAATAIDKTVQSGYNGGKNSQWLSNKCPVLIKKYKKVANSMSRPEYNSKTIGQPAKYQEVLISALQATKPSYAGFHMFSEIHVEGTTATDQEKEEIHNILTTGFIF